ANGLLIRRAEVDAEAGTDYYALLHSGMVGCRQMGRRSDASHPGSRETDDGRTIRGVLLVGRWQRRWALLRRAPPVQHASRLDDPRLRDERSTAQRAAWSAIA